MNVNEGQSPAPVFSTPEAVQNALRDVSYLADDGLATITFLALSLQRPLFLEGEPGTGKTELARALSAMTGGELVRLQCYEGIDISQAVYEWDYARQILHLRATELRGEAVDMSRIEDELYSPRFLVRRPLLRALESSSIHPAVLLIDEIDRADDEFEAFLLEMLSDFAVTIPEVGTIHATRPPIVVLTSNRTRDVHDALKRRSLYHWIEHPGFEREVTIINLRAPEVDGRLARQVTAAVQAMRDLSLYKPPGVSESINWAQALAALGCRNLDEEMIARSMGTVLKYREDLERVMSSALTDLATRAASVS